MTADELVSHRSRTQSPFVRLLATPGRVRMIDAFLRKYQTELSASDVANIADVNESTFSRNKDVLLELDVIERTRSEAGKQYYRLNVDSPLVELLAEFHTKLLKYTDEINPRTVVTEEDYIGQLITTTVDSGLDEERNLDQSSNQQESVAGTSAAVEEELKSMLEEGARRE